MRPENGFCWLDVSREQEQTPQQQYDALIGWAGRARATNPLQFDALTRWVLDDSAWTVEKLPENEAFLMQEIIGGFRKQNAKLREWLNALRASGVVNETVFETLDRFDAELSGNTQAAFLKESVVQMFADFSAMQQRSLREQIAGGETGAAGVDSVPCYGYINWLKDCDAAVQWALFMPDVVERQQQGFVMTRFEKRTLPAMRFIGFEGEQYADIPTRMEKMRQLDALTEWQSDFPYDILFMHHYGMCVDIGPWHGFWGRFMKANTPVPEDFVSFDFVPEHDGKEGLPYLSNFVYAEFAGDLAAMHQTEGYDSDAMYDVTRNRMLGENIAIPYPEKYWTAEVFLNGCDHPSTAYLFSADF